MKKLYDANNCLVNVSNSLLRHYNIPTLHPSLKELDEILDTTTKQKICLLLTDGLGTYIQEYYKESCPFIRSGILKTITSVFPPTTVAATTALTNGYYPCETGWLGWEEKFDQLSENVTMFSSILARSKVRANTMTYDLCPYVTIMDKFRRMGVLQVGEIYSFNYSDDPFFVKFFTETDHLIKNSSFVYSYLTQPDGLLHAYGVDSIEVKNIIELIDRQIQKLVTDNPDTLFLIVADHGHLNAVSHPIDEHQDFFDCLRIKDFALEGRAAAFYVLEEKKSEFYQLASKYYGDSFYILTKDEVIQEKVFGEGTFSLKGLESIGDFLLISKGKDCFLHQGDEPLASHHAGSSDEERFVNLSVFNR